MGWLVECRAVRAVVLVLAVGVGGVAGAPTMGLPPRTGVSIAGGPDDSDDEGPGGGGGGGPERPDLPGGPAAYEQLISSTEHPGLVGVR